MVRYGIILIFISLQLTAQTDSLTKHDSLKKTKLVELNEVAITVEKDNTFGITRLNNIDGTTIYAGKKSEAILVQDLNANLATNNSRQLFSKVAGINIFENEGSGSSVGIGGRGLNPNRVSNFNTRQNGYDISADALGYPESYYVPPAEAVERIEILRGAASLQFGTQFGGMINYKLIGASNKKIAVNSRQTIGSFGLYNSFNQLSGALGKIKYNVFYNYKTYKGWRPNSQLNWHNAFAQLSYQATEKLNISAEYTFLDYLNKQPGGLTDLQFTSNPSQSNRNRNWFKVNWNLYNVKLDYAFSSSLKINVLLFGVYANRFALGNLERIDRADDTTKNRNLLKDIYNNKGAEIRLLKRYALNNLPQNLLFGIRAYNGITIRQQGDGDKSNKANFNFLNPDNLENSDYKFPSQNYALFFEHVFQFTKKWSVTPGARAEYIQTNANGYYRLLNKDLAGNILLDKKIDDTRQNTRKFLLLGIGSQLKFNTAIEAYANFSQNYRSINFNDMRVVNPNFQVDPNLKDENGFTSDIGIRGTIKNTLYFDVSGFYINYNNRIGTTLITDTNTFQIIRFRTNISDSRNMGVEAFCELDWIKLFSKNSKHKFSTFINFSLIDAIYTGEKNNLFKNKLVEYVPKYIFRTGFTYAYKPISITASFAHTAQQFSDATNAVFTPYATFGIIPAYNVADVSLNYNYKKVTVGVGATNVLNEIYFTRRAEGYPGPGIIPAEPRSFYLTVGVRL